MHDPTYPLTLYYDSACSLCDAEMTNLKLRDTDGRLRFIDVSAPDFASAPPGTTRQGLLELIHATTGDRTVIRGVEVFRLAYRAVGMGGVSRVLAWRVVRPLAERVYPWIARHRYRIPRWLVWPIFEVLARRAAERAVRRRCAPGRSCRL